MWTVQPAPEARPANDNKTAAEPVLVLAYCCKNCQLNARCGGIKTTPEGDRWSCVCKIDDRTPEKDKQNKLDYFNNFFINGGKK